ncbi:hypothetical protein [Mycoplasmopsis agassizii]|uniref:Uncharacterized protein n=1 Tax=Mycoplasmopsis agassizii TaxID=33922 RepID=A0ABX4H3Z9_9BACT|nr:hypothetical protein [Mycoplasmopsis agassizii]PAF54619.1 hypothetical protein CJF60_05095 [Mycoplasmopsis agassizii]SMC20658.1 hypothetical protein SAMN02745179_01039 [Mycoplasmopsis agassizii]
MSDNVPKDDREELNVDTYCKELKDLKKNYKLYTKKNKYIFSEDGSQLKHDLSIEGEKIVKEPRKGRGPKKDKDFNDLYTRLKADLTVYIDEKFDVFEQNNNKKHDENKQQIANLEKKFDENKIENKQQIANLEKKFDENKKETKEQIANLEKKFDENKIENKQQINNLEERLNKKIDDRFDEILKAIKEKK